MVATFRSWEETLMEVSQLDNNGIAAHRVYVRLVPITSILPLSQMRDTPFPGSCDWVESCDLSCPEDHEQKFHGHSQVKFNSECAISGNFLGSVVNTDNVRGASPLQSRPPTNGIPLRHMTGSVYAMTLDCPHGDVLLG